MRTKNLIRNISIIILLVVFCMMIDLPKDLPLRSDLFGLKLDGKFVRPDLEISIFGRTFRRDLSLSLGLDLAGGSHLVFEADTSGVSKEEKKQSVEGVKNIIERRVNLFGVSEG